MKQFKIRCSAIGKIMANGRGKDSMGKTCTSYLEEWVKEQIYDRRKEFTSKHTQKGLICEDDSIDYISKQMSLDGLIKNEEHFSDEFLTGTPDVITEDFIIDVKNSYDAFTFPLFYSNLPNKDYYYQGQGYMHLTGINKFKLIYTLMDTPDNLIKREAYYFCNQNGVDLDEEIHEEFIRKMTYTGIDSKYRIKVFEFEKDQEVVDSIIKRVEDCREYVNQIKL